MRSLRSTSRCGQQPSPHLVSAAWEIRCSRASSWRMLQRLCLPLRVMNATQYPTQEYDYREGAKSLSLPCRTRSIAEWLFVVVALLSGSVLGQTVIDLELRPSLTGTAPGRDRPGTPLLHLDLLTSKAFSSGEFLIDSIIAAPSGPALTFDRDIQGWFSEPEEPIGVLFQPSGIDGGSISLASSFGNRDAWELEHSYELNWNSQQGFYSSINLRVFFSDPTITLKGADFLIDDGTQTALYTIPEPSSLKSLAVGCVVLLGFAKWRF